MADFTLTTFASKGNFNKDFRKATSDRKCFGCSGQGLDLSWN